jgi:lipooligosaccharide transport system permease protein
MSREAPGSGVAIWAVLRRNLRVWRRFFWASVVGDLAEPVLYLLALGYGLGGLIDGVQGMSYVRFIAPGLVVTAALYSATFEATYGTYTRMVPQRIFESMLATPLRSGEILIGEVLYAAAKATLAGCAVLGVSAGLGLVDAWTALLVPPLCLLCGIGFGGLAALFTCLSPAYDFFNYYFTLVVTPMVLFSGVFFPLDQLPDWAQTAAWISPLTHATSATHHLFAGRLNPQLLADVVWLLVAAALPLWPAARLLRRRLVR